MYIENLQTPHPTLLKPAQEQVNLADAAGLNEAYGFIAGAPDYDNALSEVLAYVSKEIKDTLRYPDHVADMGGSALESLRTNQVTNCIGHSLVTSECLEAAQIEHYICYTNGHAFAVVPNDTHSRLFIMDTLNPDSGQDITKRLSRNTPKDMTDQARGSEFSRGVAMFDTENLKPWVNMATSTLPEERARRASKGVMSAFESRTGRLVMENYATFKEAVGQRNISIASSSLHSIRGLYPDIDARSQHLEIRQLVQDMCALGAFDQALRTVEDYCSSFAVSNDSRPKELEGNLLRTISRSSKDPSTAAKSFDAYTEALSRTCGYSATALRGKIASVSSLAGM